MTTSKRSSGRRCSRRRRLLWRFGSSVSLASKVKATTSLDERAVVRPMTTAASSRVGKPSGMRHYAAMETLPASSCRRSRAADPRSDPIRWRRKRRSIHQGRVAAERCVFRCAVASQSPSGAGRVTSRPRSSIRRNWAPASFSSYIRGPGASKWYSPSFSPSSSQPVDASTALFERRSS